MPRGTTAQRQQVLRGRPGPSVPGQARELASRHATTKQETIKRNCAHACLADAALCIVRAHVAQHLSMLIRLCHPRRHQAVVLHTWGVGCMQDGAVAEEWGGWG